MPEEQRAVPEGLIRGRRHDPHTGGRKFFSARVDDLRCDPEGKLQRECTGERRDLSDK